ncbi:MAG: hypothetical protein L6U16_00180 [Porphyromonadaceae bacterium]|nr:MAG: hypothetical protein L6U16_00180 [Porphyromonadaceae bacterium]
MKLMLRLGDVNVEFCAQLWLLVYWAINAPKPGTTTQSLLNIKYSMCSIIEIILQKYSFLGVIQNYFFDISELISASLSPISGQLHGR